MGILRKNNYHFIGIGGIGVSAFARMLYLRGKTVTGSDLSKSEITDDLENLGIKVKAGHAADNISDKTEAVIYTVAVPEDNPELVEAKRKGLLCLTYPQALGELSKGMFTIAISGTHGKTTTTAIIGHILKKAGLDPTIIVGSKMIDEKTGAYTNFIAGKSRYLVVEACEYKRSFLNLWPKILVITNIEADHLDYYKDLDDIKSAFRKLEDRVVTEGGKIVKEEDYKKISVNFKLLVPGKHNILNAQAAVKTAEILGISNEKAKEYLKDFKGAWRRLEYKGFASSADKGKNWAVIYDDYAHHPSEIRASLTALQEKHPDRELVCVFEPHQQSRTKLMLEEFAEALSLADKVFVAPIFITREINDGITDNKLLSKAINKKGADKSAPTGNADELRKLLTEMRASKPLCIVLMGAGNIYQWTPYILK